MPKYRVEWTEGTRYCAEVEAPGKREAELRAPNVADRKLIGRFISIVQAKRMPAERRIDNGA